MQNPVGTNTDANTDAMAKVADIGARYEAGRKARREADEAQRKADDDTTVRKPRRSEAERLGKVINLSKKREALKHVRPEIVDGKEVTFSRKEHFGPNSPKRKTVRRTSRDYVQYWPHEFDKRTYHYVKERDKTGTICTKRISGEEYRQNHTILDELTQNVESNCRRNPKIGEKDSKKSKSKKKGQVRKD
jgi:K+/H+ antiporter YhaU regulatory subunit KhtT